MNAYEKIRVLSIFFGFVFICLMMYKLYRCSLCLDLEDTFHEFVNIDPCVLLGKPMAIFMIPYITLQIATILVFVIGVWKGHLVYLIFWLSLEPSNFVYLVSSALVSKTPSIPAILSATSFVMWFIGIYIYFVVKRFGQQSSFA